MKLRHLLAGGAVSVMGLGLVGVGAHAAFTTSTTSHQSISTGKLDVVLHTTKATQALSGNGTPTLTLKPSTNNNTTFSSGTTVVWIENVGTLPATSVKETLSGSYTASNSADHALFDQAYLCVVSYTTPSFVEYNGPLSSAPSFTLPGTIPPKITTQDGYIVTVYAGTEHTACGTAKGGTRAPSGGGTSTAPSLNNSALGGTITVSAKITFS